MGHYDNCRDSEEPNYGRNAALGNSVAQVPPSERFTSISALLKQLGGAIDTAQSLRAEAARTLEILEPTPSTATAEGSQGPMPVAPLEAIGYAVDRIQRDMAYTRESILRIAERLS